MGNFTNISSKEILNLVALGRIPPRVPFAPTIYEHAARLIAVTPSQLAQDPDLIVKGQLEAYRNYQHDIVTVGVDIYNVEAEALGCSVMFNENEMLPSITEILIKESTDLENLCVPNPRKDGRMPVFTEACKRLNEEIGNEVAVSGTIVGPFTLAAILRGFENFILDIAFETEFAVKQLEFAVKVIIEYAKALIKTGVGIVINESWITPPLLSPDIFRRIIYRYEAELIAQIKASGMKNIALVSGGNTAPIAEYLVKTGASVLMADYNTDQEALKNICEIQGIHLRANIDPKLVEKGDKDKMEAAAKKVINLCAKNGGFIFGCGVVSYNTRPENIKLLKEIVDRLNPYDVVLRQ